MPGEDLLGEGNWTLRVKNRKDVEKHPDFKGHFEFFPVSQATQASDVQFVQRIHSPVPEPKNAELSFKSNATRSNTIHILYQQTRAPHKIIWDRKVVLCGKQKPKLNETIPASAPGEYSLIFQLGQAEGDLDFNELSLTISKVPAARPEDNAVLRAISPERVDARIKALRCGSLTVAVQDKAGQPIANAKVEIKQLRHHFQFGCDLYGLRPNNHSEFQRNYQKRFLDLFNWAALPGAWDTLQPTRGKLNYTELESMAKWCAEHHVTACGPILLDGWSTPNWVSKDPSVAVPLARAMITNCIKHMGGLIQNWIVISNVVNEASANDPTFLGAWLRQEETKNSISGETVAKIKATAIVAGSALLWGQLALTGKDQKLLISDSTMNDSESDSDEKMYKLLEQSGSLPSAIGLKPQALTKGHRWKYEQFYKVADRFARFAPEYFHSIMVISGEEKDDIPDWDKTYTDWNSTTSGEAQQAEYVDRIYRILFSHPAVSNISWTDFCDKNFWLGAPGGLLRKNGTPKPAYNKLMDLIHKEWWTDRTLITADDGLARLRAFFGTYQITVTDAKGHSTRQQLDFTETKDVIVHL